MPVQRAFLVRPHVVRRSPDPRPGGGPGVDRGRGPRPIGRRPAGRHRRSVEPRAHREGAHRGDRRFGPLSHRRSAGRHLHRDLHAARLFDRQARRHRADRSADRQRERRPAGRRGGRDHHRHGRNTDRGRAERAPPGDDLERRPDQHPHGARVLGRDAPGAGDPDAGHARPPTCRRPPAWSSSARPAAATATRDACRWTGWAWARRATAAACRATTPTWPTRRRSPSRCRRVSVKPRCRARRSASCPRRAATRCAAPCISPTSRAAWWATTTATSCARRGWACRASC